MFTVDEAPLFTPDVSTKRYQVIIECDKRGLDDPRPYHVKDMQGKWICSSHKSFVLAQKRADELNAKA